jgi:hypothetical protein
VQVAVDAAELVGGFEHPAAHHGPVPPALDVPGVLATDLDHGFDRPTHAGTTSEQDSPTTPQLSWSASERLLPYQASIHGPDFGQPAQIVSARRRTWIRFKVPRGQT